MWCAELLSTTSMRVGVFACARHHIPVASACMQWLLIFRSMVGVGLGGAHVPVALYLEFVPTRLRGIMLVALQSFWTVGTIIEVRIAFPSCPQCTLSATLGYWSQMKGGCTASRGEVFLMQALLGWAVLSKFGWRWLLGISSIPLFGLTLLYPVIPESPYWLAACGRTEKAQEVLARVARVNKTSLPPGALQCSTEEQVRFHCLAGNSSSFALAPEWVRAHRSQVARESEACR